MSVPVAMLILLCIVAIIATIIIVRLFVFDKLTICMTDKAILVTGCCSGFGRAFVMKCLDNGLLVYAGCLTAEGVESLKQESSGRSGTLHAFQMDITSDESVQDVKNFVERQEKENGIALHAIVNNAGERCRCFNDDMLSLQDYKDAMEINVYGTIRVIKAFKQIIKRNKGRIITCTSAFVRYPAPGTGPYTFSKWAINGYLEVLRHELYPFDVCVITVEPGVYRTNPLDISNMMKTANEIWAKADPTLKEEYGEYWHGAEKRACVLLYRNAPKDLSPVVDSYLHSAIAKYPYRNYCIGCDAFLIYRPFSWLPARLQEIASQILQAKRGSAIPSVLDY